MKKFRTSIYLICCLIFLFSCNSNSLKQADAEKTIRWFIMSNSIQTPMEGINLGSITKIHKANIYSQFNTSVHVDFKNCKLNFIFTRTPKNKWFLQSVEACEKDVSKKLNEWLMTKRKLNIKVENSF